MGNFFIRQDVRQRLSKNEYEREKESWFFDEEYYTEKIFFIDKLPNHRIVLRRWCQNNLEGDVVLERSDKNNDGFTRHRWIFWFEHDTDAAAFKLMWK